MDSIAELEKKTQALIASGISELKEIEAQQQRQTQIAEIAGDSAADCALIGQG